MFWKIIYVLMIFVGGVVLASQTILHNPELIIVKMEPISIFLCGGCSLVGVIALLRGWD